MVVYFTLKNAISGSINYWIGHEEGIFNDASIQRKHRSCRFTQNYMESLLYPLLWSNLRQLGNFWWGLWESPSTLPSVLVFRKEDLLYFRNRLSEVPRLLCILKFSYVDFSLKKGVHNVIHQYKVSSSNFPLQANPTILMIHHSETL